MDLAYPNTTFVTRNISEDSLSALLITYPAWISLTITIWHHLLYLDEEVDIVWHRDYKNCVTRGLYIVARYGTDITLIYGTYISSGFVSNLTVQQCLHWAWLAELLTILTVIFRHAAIFVTIKSLWNGRTKMKHLLVIAWFASLTPAIVLSLLVAIQAQGTFLIISPHHYMSGGICVMSRVVHLLPWLLVSLSVGDFIQLVAMVVNALDAPRLSDKQIISSVNRDGAFYYFVNLVLRVFAAPILWLGGVKYYGIILPIQGVVASILPLHHYLLFSKAERSAEVMDGFHRIYEDKV